MRLCFFWCFAFFGTNFMDTWEKQVNLILHSVRVRYFPVSDGILQAFLIGKWVKWNYTIFILSSKVQISDRPEIAISSLCLHLNLSHSRDLQRFYDKPNKLPTAFTAGRNQFIHFNLPGKI